MCLKLYMTSFSAQIFLHFSNTHPNETSLFRRWQRGNTHQSGFNIDDSYAAT
jgi:hypothetical protein